MNPEQDKQGVEVIKKETAETAPKPVETSRELFDRAIAIRDEAARNYDASVGRNRQQVEKIAADPDTPAGAAQAATAEIDNLDQQAKGVIAETGNQITQIAQLESTATKLPTQEVRTTPMSPKEAKQQAQLEYIEQQTQEYQAAHPEFTQQQIDAYRNQLSRIVNFKIDPSGVDKLYLAEFRQNVGKYEEKLGGLQRTLAMETDPEKRKGLEREITETQGIIDYQKSMVEDRSRIISNNERAATEGSYPSAEKKPESPAQPAETVPDNLNQAAEQGKVQEATKFQVGQVVSLKAPGTETVEPGWTITEINDADYGQYVTASSPDGKFKAMMPGSELAKYNRTSEAATGQNTEASAESDGAQVEQQPIQPETEKIQPDFQLLTVKTEQPLEEWSVAEIRGVLIPQLQKDVDSITQKLKTADKTAMPIQWQHRVQDLQGDIANLERYIQLRETGLTTEKLPDQPAQTPKVEQQEGPIESIEPTEGSVETPKPEANVTTEIKTPAQDVKPTSEHSTPKPEAVPETPAEKRQKEVALEKRLFDLRTETKSGQINQERATEIIRQLQESLSGNNNFHRLVDGAFVAQSLRNPALAGQFLRRAESNNNVSDRTPARSCAENSCTIARMFAESGDLAGAQASIIKAKETYPNIGEGNMAFENALKAITKQNRAVGRALRGQ